MDKDALRKRYHYLWIGESISAVMFIALTFCYAYQDGVWQHWIARSYSVSVAVLILIQGTLWWRMKLRLLSTEQRDPSPKILATFRAWRSINWMLIGGVPIVAAIGATLTDQPLISRDTVLGAVFMGAAVLEQINYYYVQLMYDSPHDWRYLRAHRRLRVGSIGKALSLDAARIHPH